MKKLLDTHDTHKLFHSESVVMKIIAMNFGSDKFWKFFELLRFVQRLTIIKFFQEHLNKKPFEKSGYSRY